MNALVTGATGFLGSHLCRRLVKEGFNVTALCRPTSNMAALADLPIVKKVGDVTHSESVRQAVDGNDFVFHAAAHGMYWGRKKQAQNDTNIQGTKNIVEACKEFGVRRLVYVSSMTAIGIPDGPEHPAGEDFKFNLEGSPLNYHISKKRAEEVVLEAVDSGLDCIIVNPAYIWGPFGSKYRVAEHVQKVRNKKIVPYFTGGICIVHVDDVVDGIMSALHRGKTGERYILGGDNITLKEIAELAAEYQDLKPKFIPLSNAVIWLAAAIMETVALVTRRRPRITFVTHQLASRYQYYDSSKARHELGFKARDFKTILAECVSFLESKKEMENAADLN
ncbi:MAG: NAD-dependent epimerase/dehydratase family protein [Pyrinomonadaceae bacterium]